MKRPYIAYYGRVLNHDYGSCKSSNEVGQFENRIILSLNRIGMDTVTDADGTWETSNIEPSDPDDFLLMSGTYFTKAVEPSDPDDFNMINGISKDQTGLTETIEPSDPDDFLLRIGTIAEGTEQTFTLEPCDPDDFLTTLFK